MDIVFRDADLKKINSRGILMDWLVKQSRKRFWVLNIDWFG